MAPRNRHELDCLHLFQKPMAEVHEWLDGLNCVYPFQLFGEYHRTFRHNGYGVRYCLEKWGPDGEKAALVHLLRDWDDRAFVKQHNFEQLLPYMRKALMWFNQMPEDMWVMLNPQFKNWDSKGWVNQAHKEGLFERGLSKGQLKYYTRGVQHP